MQSPMGRTVRWLRARIPRSKPLERSCFLRKFFLSLPFQKTPHLNPCSRKVSCIAPEASFLPRMWQLPIGVKDKVWTACRLIFLISSFSLEEHPRPPAPPRPPRGTLPDPSPAKESTASDLPCSWGSVSALRFCCLRVYLSPSFCSVQQAAPGPLACYLSFPTRDLWQLRVLCILWDCLSPSPCSGRSSLLAGTSRSENRLRERSKGGRSLWAQGWTRVPWSLGGGFSGGSSDPEGPGDISLLWEVPFESHQLPWSSWRVGGGDSE